MPPGHPYRDGTRGRSIRGGTGKAGTHLAALVQCSRCPAVGQLNIRAIMPPEKIDQKFHQRGWRLDPHVCPECATRREEKPMAAPATPSPAAIQAQAKTFNLLNLHFDPDKGAFAPDWNDQRIATTAGLAVDTVVAFREAAFGKLKEPPEIAELRSDIAAAEQLLAENHATLTGEMIRLKAKLVDVSKRWAV